MLWIGLTHLLGLGRGKLRWPLVTTYFAQALPCRWTCSVAGCRHVFVLLVHTAHVSVLQGPTGDRVQQLRGRPPVYIKSHVAHSFRRSLPCLLATWLSLSPPPFIHLVHLVHSRMACTGLVFAHHIAATPAPGPYRAQQYQQHRRPEQYEQLPDGLQQWYADLLVQR